MFHVSERVFHEKKRRPGGANRVAIGDGTGADVMRGRARRKRAARQTRERRTARGVTPSLCARRLAGRQRVTRAPQIGGAGVETFNVETFRSAGLPDAFAQDNHSYSARGVVRGLYYQLEQPQGKLVRCTPRHHPRRGRRHPPQLPHLRPVDQRRTDRRQRAAYSGSPPASPTASPS